MTTFSGLFEGGGSVGLIDEQIFTSSGTWTKPENANSGDLLEYVVIGGGGNGAYGGRKDGSSDQRRAGLGGTAGEIVVGYARCGELSATVPIIVGSAGNSSYFDIIEATGGTTPATASGSGWTGGPGENISYVGFNEPLPQGGTTTAVQEENDGEDGNIPGGGGAGAALWEDGNGWPRGIPGSGARGEVRVRVIRGA